MVHVDGSAGCEEELGSMLAMVSALQGPRAHRPSSGQHMWQGRPIVAAMRKWGEKYDGEWEIDLNNSAEFVNYADSKSESGSDG